jgi:hypothetical protein
MRCEGDRWLATRLRKKILLQSRKPSFDLIPSREAERLPDYYPIIPRLLVTIVNQKRPPFTQRTTTYTTNPLAVLNQARDERDLIRFKEDRLEKNTIKESKVDDDSFRRCYVVRVLRERQRRFDDLSAIEERGLDRSSRIGDSRDTRRKLE